MTESGLNSAQQRGARSLVVRGLLSVTADGPVFSQEVVETVLGAATAPSWVAAYVATADQPTTLAGDSTYVYRAEPSWLLDFVSPGGIHQLGVTAADDAEALILALAKNVFDFGFLGNPTDAVLFVGNSASPEWVKIREGELEVGQFSAQTFAPSISVAEWTGTEVAAVFGGA
jgi:hypothetical protein